MPPLSFRPSPVVLAVAASALALAACSDSPVGPIRSLASSEASFSAMTSGTTMTIVSDASSQFCSATLGVFTTFPTSQAGITSGCTPARDLEADAATPALSSLGTYNPGWQQLTGAHWIGFTANGGRPTPGIYAFQQTFTLPAGVSNPNLSLDVRADNVAAVYLNGTKLGQQAMHDCNDGDFGPCFWTSGGTLHVNANSGFVASPGVNYLTFLVANVPTGFPVAAPKGGTAPQYACESRVFQEKGSHLFSGDDAVFTSPLHIGPHPTGPGNPMTPTPVVDQPNPGQDGCENPAGLAFTGTITWTAAPPPQICDFITFGRLVFDVAGKKVVISGNAGGNAPGGGILGEMQISIGGADYHVHTIDSYGPTTNAPLFPDQYARVITGRSGTHTVELRLRDNPNPGKGEPGTQEGDKVWLKIDGVVVVPTQALDKGNIQLHLNCRGPKD